MKENDTKSNQKITIAEEIWNDIRNKEMSVFALPSQKVSDYCTPVFLDPNKLFLIHKASSVLTALESVVGNKYICEIVDKYIVISKK